MVFENRLGQSLFRHILIAQWYSLCVHSVYFGGNVTAEVALRTTILRRFVVAQNQRRYHGKNALVCIEVVYAEH